MRANWRSADRRSASVLNDGDYSFSDAVAILSSLASALSYLHDRAGAIHRALSLAKCAAALPQTIALTCPVFSSAPMGGP